MNDRDYIELWLIGFIALVILSILFAVYLKSEAIVNAAYKASTPIVEVLR